MHPCRRFHPEDRLKITDAPSEARIGKDDVVGRIAKRPEERWRVWGGRPLKKG
jgi:hypothetical protein